MAAIARIEQPSRALLAQLTHRQRLFLQAYVMDPLRNGAAAYRAAGYNCRTNQIAAVAACRLLSRVKIQDALAAVDAELEGHAEVSPRTIVRQLTRVGFSDVRRLFRDGRLIDIEDLGQDEAAIVASFDVKRAETRRVGEGLDARIITESVITVRLRDSVSALNSLCRIKGMFHDKVELNGKVTLEATMARVNEMQRAKRIEAQAVEAEVLDGPAAPG